MMQGNTIACQTCQSSSCNGCSHNSQQQFSGGGQMQPPPQFQSVQDVPQQMQMNDGMGQMNDGQNPQQNTQVNTPEPIVPNESYTFVDMSAWDIIFWSIEEESVPEVVQVLNVSTETPQVLVAPQVSQPQVG